MVFLLLNLCLSLFLRLRLLDPSNATCLLCSRSWRRQIRPKNDLIMKINSTNCENLWKIYAKLKFFNQKLPFELNLRTYKFRILHQFWMHFHQKVFKYFENNLEFLTLRFSHCSFFSFLNGSALFFFFLTFPFQPNDIFIQFWFSLLIWLHTSFQRE